MPCAFCFLPRKPITFPSSSSLAGAGNLGTFQESNFWAHFFLLFRRAKYLCAQKRCWRVYIDLAAHLRHLRLPFNTLFLRNLLCTRRMSASSYPYSGPSMQQLLQGAGKRNGQSRLSIIGHRGVGKNISTISILGGEMRPSIMENTIVSFNTAARNGADFVEFDVQVTKDGHPIIFHDDFIVVNDKENNCLVHKRIGDLMLDEFLQIGFQKDSQKAERALYRRTLDGSFSPWTVSLDDSLCTLKEAFEQVSPMVGFDIELKFDDYNATSDQELKRSIDAVLKVVNESCMGRKIFFSSFHPDAVLLLRQEQSLYPVLFLTDGVPGIYPDHRRSSLAAAIEVCLSGNLQGIVSEVKAILQHPEAVQRIKAAGLALFTYGDLNNLSEILHLQESLGVDGLVVDHVLEMVIENLKDKGSIESIL
eukprot:c15487_g1_i1 orf=88-1347(+)